MSKIERKTVTCIFVFLCLAAPLLSAIHYYATSVLAIIVAIVAGYILIKIPEEK